MSDAIPFDTVTEAIGQWIAAVTGLPVMWTYEGGDRPETNYVELDIQQSTSRSSDWTKTADNVLTFAPIPFTMTGSTITAIAHGLKTGTGSVRLAGAGLPGSTSSTVDYWVRRLTNDTLEIATTFYQSMTSGRVTSSSDGAGTIVPTAQTFEQGKELVRTQAGFREARLQIQVFADNGTGLLALAKCENIKSSVDLHSDDVNAAGAGIGVIGDAIVVPGRRGGILEPRATMNIALHLASAVEDYITFIERVQIGSTSLGISPRWIPGPPQ